MHVLEQNCSCFVTCSIVITRHHPALTLNPEACHLLCFDRSGALLFASSCLLSIVCSLLSIFCCLLSDTSRLLSLFAAWSSPFAVCSLSFAICCRPYVVCCLVFPICCLSFGVCFLAAVLAAVSLSRNYPDPDPHLLYKAPGKQPCQNARCFLVVGKCPVRVAPYTCSHWTNM